MLNESQHSINQSINSSKNLLLVLIPFESFLFFTLRGTFSLPTQRLHSFIGRATCDPNFCSSYVIYTRRSVSTPSTSSHSSQPRPEHGPFISYENQNEKTFRFHCASEALSANIIVIIIIHYFRTINNVSVTF